MSLKYGKDCGWAWDSPLLQGSWECVLEPLLPHRNGPLVLGCHLVLLLVFVISRVDDIVVPALVVLVHEPDLVVLALFL